MVLTLPLTDCQSQSLMGRLFCAQVPPPMVALSTMPVKARSPTQRGLMLVSSAVLQQAHLNMADQLTTHLQTYRISNDDLALCLEASDH